MTPAASRSDRSSRVRAVLGAVVSLALMGVALACTDPAADRAIVAPPGTVAPLAALEAEESSISVLTIPPGFVQADTRAVLLPVFPAYDFEQPAIPVFGGEATISGTVEGPEGPVEGATVRIERFVDGRGGFAEVTTNADGNYAAYGLLGGHFRLRAWLSPDLTTTEPQTTFLAADRQLTVNVGMQKYDANHLQAALDRGDPRIEDFSVLKVLWVNEEVNEDTGVVEGLGIPDVEVSVTPRDRGFWEIFGEDKALTNADGYVEFFMVCKEVGAWTMLVSTPEVLIEPRMPECIPREPGTTVPEAANTTTTLEGQVAIPPGQSFKPPFDGPIPAGVYLSQAENNCDTEYEALLGPDTWTRQRKVGRRIESTVPMRNLRAINGVPACTFTRLR